jgi:hypothetical protein
MPRISRWISRFKEGDWVRLRKCTQVPAHELRKVARVHHYIQSADGSLVLDRSIAGFRYWNEMDLRHAPPRK